MVPRKDEVGRSTWSKLPTFSTTWINSADVNAQHDLTSTCNVIFRAYLSDDDPIDTDNVRITAHEIRALAASWKATNSIPLEDVLRTASWKNATTFTSHYLRDLCQQQDGLYSLGPLVAAERIIQPRPQQWLLLLREQYRALPRINRLLLARNDDLDQCRALPRLTAHWVMHVTAVVT